MGGPLYLSQKVFIFSNSKISHYYSQLKDATMGPVDEPTDDAVERQRHLSSRLIYFSICLKSITVTIAAAGSGLFTIREWSAIWVILVWEQVRSPVPEVEPLWPSVFITQPQQIARDS